MEETLEVQMKDAEVQKAKAYKEYSAARADSLTPNDKRIAAKKAHKDACKDFSEKKAAYTGRDKRLVTALVNTVEEINTYLAHNRGKYESIIEQVIGSAPINAKHNPFYNGSFNGNDCQRLLHNYNILFEELRKASESEESESVKDKVREVTRLHERIFAAFSETLPLFRSTKLLSPLEQHRLIENIKEFWEAYFEGTGSITIKIHMLIFHTQFFSATLWDHWLLGRGFGRIDPCYCKCLGASLCCT